MFQDVALYVASACHSETITMNRLPGDWGNMPDKQLLPAMETIQADVPRPFFIEEKIS